MAYGNNPGEKKYGNSGIGISTGYSISKEPLDFRSVCDDTSETSTSNPWYKLKSDCYPGLISYNLKDNKLFYARYDSTGSGSYEWSILADKYNHYVPSEISTTSALSSGIATDITDNSNPHVGKCKVITGIKLDSNNHVTGIEGVDIYSTDTHLTNSLTAYAIDSSGTSTAWVSFDQQSDKVFKLKAGTNINLVTTDDDSGNKVVTINNTYSYTPPTYYWANVKVTTSQDSTTSPSKEPILKSCTLIGGDLTVDSSHKCSAGYFLASSDVRLKENIVDFIPEKSILDLPIKKFDFINGAKNQIGCIAQDLQEICPEIVEERNDGYLAIEENKLVYLLLDEVKKLKKEVEELKKDRGIK